MNQSAFSNKARHLPAVSKFKTVFNYMTREVKITCGQRENIYEIKVPG